MLIAYFIKAKVTSITIGAMGMGIDVAFLGKQNFLNKIYVKNNGKCAKKIIFKFCTIAEL